MTCRHWLSYSHSDQALLRNRDLDGTWDALVVPGTLATFYFEGTGGFVLAQRAPYVIDPRTPLLQTTTEIRRSDPRASHLKLLEAHEPQAVLTWPYEEIPRTFWEDGRWPEVVHRVLDFQEQYSSAATAKLSKYERLKAEARNEPIDRVERTDAPTRFVPPYWAVRGSADPWWRLTRDSIEFGVTRHRDSLQPILALHDDAPIGVFSELIADLPPGVREVFCWRGSWDELRATDQDVEQWVDVIRTGQERGIGVTNLYGGFLSALLLPLGLRGFGHGVGYSESRDVRRLGETGAPPTRYYVPAIHAFLPVPTAQALIQHLPAQWSCTCDICQAVAAEGRPDVTKLSPEQRKAHFLLCRRNEIAAIEDDPREVLDRVGEVAQWLAENPVPALKTRKFVGTLSTWHRAVGRWLNSAA